MKLFYPVLLILIMISFSPGFAQNQKYIHQTFQLDTATTVRLDLFGEFEIEPWVGDAVMIETKVSLYDASGGIFKFVIEQGRYEVEAQLEGEILTLVSKDKIRRPIGTSKGYSKEEVTMRVFIPEKMKSTGANTWTLPESERKKEFSTKSGGR